MIKTIAATFITLLGGLNYLKPEQQTYRELSGFYTITANDENSYNTMDLSTYDSQNTLIQLWNANYTIHSNFYGNPTIAEPKKIKNNSTGVILTTGTYGSLGYQEFTLTNYYTNEYKYVFFNKVRVKTNELKNFNLTKQDELSEGQLINKSFDMLKFNPNGMYNLNYNEYPLLPSTATTPIDLKQNLLMIYKDYIVTGLSSVWIDGNGTELKTNQGTTTILDTNYKVYMYTEISYKIGSETKTETISTAVYETANNNGTIKTVLTSGLNNRPEPIYVVADLLPQNPSTNFINSFANNAMSSGNAQISLNGNIGDVFSLLAQAFNGIGGFFTLTLIPGITLGTLFVAPLLVSLILWLIHLFKRH